MHNEAPTILIIPCYNEQDAILGVYNEVCAAGYAALVVNDHSTDNSLAILRANRVPHLDLQLNLGIGGAMQAGYRYALRNGYGIAVQCDGDGQHDPAWVAAITAPIKSGEADMVIGSRYIEKQGFQSSVFRRLGIGFFKGLLLALSGKTITDATSGFRAANRKVMLVFDSDYSKDFPEPDSTMLVLRNKLRVLEVPVAMRARRGGTSSISPFRAIYYMLKVTLGILLAAIQPRTVKG
jgi:glycosyltransferase involved in cell wall biosynthesis